MQKRKQTREGIHRLVQRRTYIRIRQVNKEITEDNAQKKINKIIFYIILFFYLFLSKIYYIKKWI